jgi:hypothetical protein
MSNNQEWDYWVAVIGGLGGGIISGMLIWALDKDPRYLIVPAVTILLIVGYGAHRLNKLKQH